MIVQDIVMPISVDVSAGVIWRRSVVIIPINIAVVARELINVRHVAVDYVVGGLSVVICLVLVSVCGVVIPV